MLFRGGMTVSFVVMVAAVACGGSTASSVTASEAGTGDSSAGSSSSGGSSGEAGAASGDDGGEDASWIISGGSSSGSSSSSGSGATSSSGGPPPGDGGPDQIQCGANGPCDSTSQVCCATKAGRACVATGSCTGDSLACSATNSCASGDVCCEELTATGLVRTRCVAACPAGSLQLCNTSAECKAGYECRHGIDGYGRCGLVADRDGGGKDAGDE